MPRDLRALFDPRSVAVVGASDDPAKWGNWLGRGALKGEHRRPVYLVNRNGGKVLGRSAYRSLGELPDAPELVVVSVPAAAFEQTVDDALAAGARALIGITAGLGELGDEASAREAALVGRVRDAGAVLLGPNCLGVYDAASDLGLASNEFPPGSIGLASQSGNLALELGILAREAGLGFSRCGATASPSSATAAATARSPATSSPRSGSTCRGSRTRSPPPWPPSFPTPPRPATRSTWPAAASRTSTPTPTSRAPCSSRARS